MKQLFLIAMFLFTSMLAKGEECKFQYKFSLKGAKEMVRETPKFKVTPKITSPYRGIGFSLENKTKSELEIVWDQASIVDTEKKAHGVTHEGVKFKDAAASKPPTIVPPGAKIDEFVTPSNYIAFNKRWEVYPFLYVRSGTPQDVIEPYDGLTPEFIKGAQEKVNQREGIGDGNGLKGKSFSLFLPIKAGNKAEKENLIFEIIDVTCEK